jgi:hypothetical protein
MDMGVKNRLADAFAAVDSDVETGDGRVFGECSPPGVRATHDTFVKRSTLLTSLSLLSAWISKDFVEKSMTFFGPTPAIGHRPPAIRPTFGPAQLPRRIKEKLGVV